MAVPAIQVARARGLIDAIVECKYAQAALKAIDKDRLIDAIVECKLYPPTAYSRPCTD